MSITRRVILCGDSIFIKAIETALAKESYMDIQRLDLIIPDLLSQIVAFKPDLVMLAEDETPSDLALALLNYGLPLVQLHPNRAALLTHQTVSVLCAADVERLIENTR